jgi:2,3-bisphosphoglycerate-dependent phosphoglycerate mutase
MTRLILMRHGQSQFNLAMRFTGWHDDDLTPLGERQARRAGRLLRQAGITPDLALVSPLRRASQSLRLALAAMARSDLPVKSDWRLSERHAGALEGMDKAAAKERFGREAVQLWRESLEALPPLMPPSDPRHPARKTLYAHLPASQLPCGESMALVLERLEPAWRHEILPRLRQGACLLVVAHAGSLWALLRLLSSSLPLLAIAHANPLLVELDNDLKPGRPCYLDPQGAPTLPWP